MICRDGRDYIDKPEIKRRLDQVAREAKELRLKVLAKLTVDEKKALGL